MDRQHDSGCWHPAVQVSYSIELMRAIAYTVAFRLIRNSHLSFAVDAKINAGGTEEEIFSHMLQQIVSSVDAPH